MKLCLLGDLFITNVGEILESKDAFMKVKGQIRRPFCETTKKNWPLVKLLFFLTNETIIQESNRLTSNNLLIITDR